jgi:hypothetical protein
MRTRIALFSLFLAVSLAFLQQKPWNATPSAQAAGSQCKATYTVQHGDWLADIARRKGTTVAELIRLNPRLRKNPNLIFRGQVLCIQAADDQPGATQTPSVASQVVIEVTYTYGPTDDEEGMVLANGRRVGKHIAYAIEPANDAIHLTSSIDEIASTLLSQPAPVFFGVRNEDEQTYSLIALGPPLAFSQWMVSEGEDVDIQPDCEAIPLQSVLGGVDIEDVKITMWLAAANGQSYPLAVTHLNIMPDSSTADACYGAGRIAFVLLPATSGRAGQYRIVMLLTDNIIGPPGRPRQQRCEAWAQARGWFYRWLRAWYGC